MTPRIAKAWRRAIRAELSQLSREQLATLSQNPDALADALLARARQSPDWPQLATP